MPILKRLLARCIPDGTPLPILSGPLKGRRWLAGPAPGPAKGLSVIFNRSEPGRLAAAARRCRSVHAFDVEGAEASVLRGAAGLPRERRPSLLLSTHGDGPKQECFRYLRDLGYGGPEPLDRHRGGRGFRVLLRGILRPVPGAGRDGGTFSPAGTMLPVPGGAGLPRYRG